MSLQTQKNIDFFSSVFFFGGPWQHLGEAAARHLRMFHGWIKEYEQLETLHEKAPWGVGRGKASNRDRQPKTRGGGHLWVTGRFREQTGLG